MGNTSCSNLRASPKADPQLPEVTMATRDNTATLQRDELCDAERLLVGVDQPIATRVLGGIRGDKKSLRNPTLSPDRLLDQKIGAKTKQEFASGMLDGSQYSVAGHRSS